MGAHTMHDLQILDMRNMSTFSVSHCKELLTEKRLFDKNDIWMLYIWYIQIRIAACIACIYKGIIWFVHPNLQLLLTSTDRGY